MLEYNCLKVIRTFRLFFHFCLFVAFLILSALALRDLLSQRTTFYVSQDYRDLVLPSFTTCLYSGSKYGTFDQHSLASKSSNLLLERKWATLKSLDLKFSNGSSNTIKNDATKKYYNIQSYCKPRIDNESTCEPCLSFHTNEMKDKIQSAQVIINLIPFSIQ